MMIRGSTSGASSTVRIAVRPNSLPRTSTKAAAVPSTVATMPVQSAVTKERIVALIQAGEDRKVSYQRSEKPCGGNSMNVPDVKETGTTKKDGTQRKATISATTVQSKARLPRRLGRSARGRTTV